MTQKPEADMKKGTAACRFGVLANLTNFCLLPCWCASKLVKGDVKPLINVSVDLVVLVTNLLRGQAFLKSLQQNVPNLSVPQMPRSVDLFLAY